MLSHALSLSLSLLPLRALIPLAQRPRFQVYLMLHRTTKLLPSWQLENQQSGFIYQLTSVIWVTYPLKSLQLGKMVFEMAAHGFFSSHIYLLFA
jgi:hypothetical protein